MLLSDEAAIARRYRDLRCEVLPWDFDMVEE